MDLLTQLVVINFITLPGRSKSQENFEFGTHLILELDHHTQT